jgi:tetratricopeptide (TPR) repeat protein
VPRQAPSCFMSNAAAMPKSDSPMESSPAKGRRSRQVTVAFAALAALLLLCLGLQGRRQAILLARIDALDSVRDVLQQKLDEDLIRADPFAGGPPPLSPGAAALATQLTTEIARFERENRAFKMSAPESLEFRMSQATLANADQRFGDAAKLLTSADEASAPANNPTASQRSLRVLRIRGDSLSGLGKWQDALERYRQVLAERPDALATATRAVQCERALAGAGGAAKSYAGLGAAHNRRGDWLLLQDKSDAALGHYGMAIGILKRLVEKEGLSQWKGDLARSHANRGNAALVQGRPDLAVTHLQEAITIQNGQNAPARSNDQEVNLGVCHGNFGTALFGQQKLDAAIEHYGKAIEILSGLTNGTPVPSGAIVALAVAYNNRGAALRAQGKLQPATADFDLAIQILEQLADQHPQTGSPTNQSGGDTGPMEAVTVDAIIGFSGNGVEIEARPRRVGSADPRELTALLTTLRQNRGLIPADLGKSQRAAR